VPEKGRRHQTSDRTIDAKFNSRIAGSPRVSEFEPAMKKGFENNPHQRAIAG
jgi:hypothetical protein